MPQNQICHLDLARTLKKQNISFIKFLESKQNTQCHNHLPTLAMFSAAFPSPKQSPCQHMSQEKNKGVRDLQLCGFAAKFQFSKVRHWAKKESWWLPYQYSILLFKRDCHRVLVGCEIPGVWVMASSKKAIPVVMWASLTFLNITGLSGVHKRWQLLKKHSSYNHFLNICLLKPEEKYFLTH